MCASAARAGAQADVSTATLKGVVADQDAAVLSGAVVTVRSRERGVARTARTDEEGAYQISLLQPGLYEPRVSERTQQANTIHGVRIESPPNVGRDLTTYVFTLPGVSGSERARRLNLGGLAATP